MPPAITPPRTLTTDRLTKLDLGAGALHDELELDTVHVTGALPEAAIANLELDVAHLDDVDLAGACWPRLMLRNCRVTGGNLASFAATKLERVRFEGCLLAHSDLQDALRGARTPYVDVLAAAGTSAGAPGIELMRDDDAEP